VAILEFADDVDVAENPKTMWNKQSHSASEYGSTCCEGSCLSGRFPFPEVALCGGRHASIFVSGKPAAVVVDFFCGSATTGHAVMRLNKQDGGRRQPIMVTNNEVAADERKALREQGLRQAIRGGSAGESASTSPSRALSPSSTEGPPTAAHQRQLQVRQ